MQQRVLSPLIVAAALLATGTTTQASIVDASGDYLVGFTGSKLGDLDVLSASAVLDTASHVFTLSATMAANVGTTASGFYIWGVNRGAGTARFATNGVGGVLFDMVVRLNPNGSGSVTDLIPGGLPQFSFAAGTAQVNGATIAIDLDEARLPSRGFADSAYTWNLWPRDSAAPAGFGQISDFAPDNSNFATLTVPEPTSALLLALAGAALVVTSRRQRR